MNLRFPAVPAVLVAVLLALGGCSKGPPGGDAAPGGPGAGQKPHILRFGNGSEPQDLDPQAVSGIPELNIITGLFESLLTPDPKDLHPVPGQAESWEVSDDGLVYTFHLRSNLRWSDGVPITADDYIQSYKRILNPAFPSVYSYLLWFVVGAQEYNAGKQTDFSKVGFKALDDRTLQVTLKSPTPFLLNMIANHYVWDAVPTRVIAKYGPLDRIDTPWTRVGHIVGSGPFILSEWKPNQRIVLTRNPQYWDAASVKLDEIDFLPTENIATEERMFRTGQVDVTSDVPNTKRDVYRKEYPQVFHTDPYLGIYYFRCNVTKPPLTDKRVRRALALAIDRESLIREVIKGGEAPAYAVSYPNDAGYTPTAQLRGGVAEARRLLAEAGYPDGRGCPPIQLLYNTSENHKAIMEALQAMWRKNLGIDVELKNQEWKVYLDTQHITHDFMLQRSGWIADYMDPNVFLEIWVTGNGNNDTLWGNPDYDRIYAESLKAKTQDERYALYQKLDAILVDECPVIPLYYYTRVNLQSARVTGYYPTLLDIHPWKFVDVTGN